MKTSKTCLLAAALIGVAAPAARADAPPDPATDEAAPAPKTGADDVATPAAPVVAGSGTQLVLPKGHWLINAQLDINLSSNEAFKPVALSPDVWYGVTDKLTLGLVHSGLGETGFIGSPTHSLCLTGTSNGCAKFYDNVGLDGRYALKTGTMAWAFDGGLYFDSLDPVQLAIKLGVDGRFTKDKLAVEIAPSIEIGLTNRAPTPAMGVTVIGPQNTEQLNVPITALYTVAPKVAIVAQLGLVLPFTLTGDIFRVPFAIGAQYRVDDHINVNLAFSLPALFGGSKLDTGADLRVLTLGGGYAF